MNPITPGLAKRIHQASAIDDVAGAKTTIQKIEAYFADAAKTPNEEMVATNAKHGVEVDFIPRSPAAAADSTKFTFKGFRASPTDALRKEIAEALFERLSMFRDFNVYVSDTGLVTLRLYT